MIHFDEPYSVLTLQNHRKKTSLAPTDTAAAPHHPAPLIFHGKVNMRISQTLVMRKSNSDKIRAGEQ